MNDRVETRDDYVWAMAGHVFDMQMILCVMNVFALGSRALTYHWISRYDNNPPVLYQEELKLGENDSIASEWS